MWPEERVINRNDNRFKQVERHVSITTTITTITTTSTVAAAAATITTTTTTMTIFIIIVDGTRHLRCNETI